MLQNEIKIKQIANYVVRWWKIRLYCCKTTICEVHAKPIRGKMLDLFVWLVLLTQNATRDGRENVTSQTAHH